MNERLALYIEACCEKGVRSFWMGGSEHCGPGVVHPRLFRRMITPYDKRIVDIIHDYGGVVNLHTHGKLKDILDDIVEIGVDVMSPIETGLRGDVTLAEVKARVGDRICLKGNLDDMAYLALEPADEVRAGGRGLHRPGGGGRRIHPQRHGRGDLQQPLGGELFGDGQSRGQLGRLELQRRRSRLRRDGCMYGNQPIPAGRPHLRPDGCARAATNPSRRR